MGESQIKIVRASNSKTKLKNLPNKEINKSADGKNLVAFATLGCVEV